MLITYCWLSALRPHLLLGLLLLASCHSAPAPAPPPRPDWLTAQFREPGRGREADVRRLRATLAAEPAPTGEYRFRLLRRLGIYLSHSPTPDSATPLLRQALRLRQSAALPLETAEVLAKLAQHQWRRNEYDSARYYHRAAADLLRRAFPDSFYLTRPRPVDGRRPVPAVMLAEHSYNAGLACAALGQLPQAMRYYAQARRAYAQAADPAGLAWVHSLFAETLQKQRQPARAAGHFEQALAALRRFGREQPARAAQEWASTLTMYAPDLLARQPERLRQLAEEGLALLTPLRATHPTDRDLLASATRLTLLAARADLARASAAPPFALAEARELLGQLRAAAGPDFRASLGYYPAAADWAALQADQARRRGETADHARYRTIALAYRDSIDDPRVRARTSLNLTRQLVQWHDYARAIGELRPLLPVYRAAADQAELHTAYTLLTAAYAGAGRLDSAFVSQRRAEVLDDALRSQAQQTALAEAETRYRTSLQAARIGQLTRDAVQVSRQSRLAWLSVGLLLLLLGGSAVALRTARRLNRRLDGQRRQIEEQAERLTQLDQNKSQFFANISHELRTPLTLVLGPVEQLLADDELTARARQRLAQVQRSGQRLQGLVNNILDLTKLEAGQLGLHPRPVPAAALLRRLVEPFQTLTAQRGIRLSLHHALPEALTLLLDAEQVEQVVGNLLSNALRHTPDNGRIEVRAAAAGPGQWQLEVQDSGPGVAPDERGRIFERFYQSQRHRVAGGTGIGLALSRELAQLMGGTLTVGGAPGEGATFVFRFRAPEAPTPAPANAEPPAAEPDLPAEAAGERPRVLLVEDHADLRAYLRELLGPGYAVREAANGHEALARLAEEPADLIISDEMMPGMSGTELLRHLQQQPDWRAVPFLLVTARADLAHRLLALDIGVADYLAKPFVAAELLARVRNLLRNQAERRQYQDEAPSAEPETASGAAAPLRLGAAPAAEAAVAVPVADAAVLAAADAELLGRLRTVAEAAVADEEFGPARLAAAAGLSERTLYRRLKELTGLTPAAFVREVRLLQARHLLETKAVTTVAEAAFAVGFANASHFGRVYAERFGRTPGEDKGVA